jgi:hypothetical protein
VSAKSVQRSAIAPSAVSGGDVYDGLRLRTSLTHLRNAIAYLTQLLRVRLPTSTSSSQARSPLQKYEHQGCERLYEGMNIRGVTGLKAALKATLLTLGALGVCF